MKKKSFFILLSALFLTTGSTQAQSIQQADELPIVNIDEMAEGEDYEDEIDNYDFLYMGDNTATYDDMKVQELMDEAKSHIGARYVYGSKGPKTFDCSGFTGYVYKQQRGIYIGASSREQYAINQPISRSEMQPGDLVFFTSPRSGRNVGHVGIIVDVDPITDTFHFIHASTKEGVKISKSTDGYYSRRYIGVRRVKQ